MRYIYFVTIIVLFSLGFGCTINQELTNNGKPAYSDTIRIANDSLEYEVLIIDPGFNSWLVQYGKPRGYYSQPYLEARNVDWVNGWNMNFYSSRYPNMFLSTIDYQYGINYGYEVNYLLYNYLVYFQTTNKIKLGSFVVKP
jgi:hypothetical protein